MFEQKVISKTRASTGQALSEYTLAGLLIGVVCIAGMTAVGNALNSTLQSLFLSKRPAVVVAKQTTPEPIPSTITQPGLPDTSVISQPAPSAVASGLRFTTANGTNIALPNYPKSVSETIKVIGANGATTVLSDTLNQVAQQLLAAGEIDATQYNDLASLANQGHRLGNLEKALEDAAALSTSSADYAKMKVTFDGKAYSPKRLSDAQGFDTNSQEASMVKDPLDTSSALGETESFLKLYDKAIKNGALTDPAVQQIVSSMVSQIAYLSEAAVCNTYKAADGDISPADIRSHIVSDMTHADSQNICQAGNGKDSGIQCAE